MAHAALHSHPSIHTSIFILLVRGRVAEAVGSAGLSRPPSPQQRSLPHILFDNNPYLDEDLESGITALGCGRTLLSHACVCVSGYTVKKVKLNNLLGSLIRPCQCVCGPKFIIKQWGNIVLSSQATHEVRNALWPNCTFLALKSILRTWQYWLNGTCCTSLTSYSTIIITYSCVASACISTFREDLESGNYCIRLWSHILVARLCVCERLHSKKGEVEQFTRKPFPTMPMLVWT